MRRLATVLGLLTAAFLGSALFILSRAKSTAVEEIPVTQGDILQVVVARGKVEPYAELELGAKVRGRIQEILVREGDWVKAGQVVARLDDEELQAQLRQAQATREAARARLDGIEYGARPEERAMARANLDQARDVLENARVTWERYRDLSREGAISKSQLDEVETRYQVAQSQYRSAQENLRMVEAGPREEARRAARAELAKAEADLQYINTFLANTAVRSPVDGLVTKRLLEPGAVVPLEVPRTILTIADMRRVRVRAEVDETDVRKVRAGLRALITADAYPGKEFTGKVVEMGAVVGKKTLRGDNPAEMLDARVLDVKIDLDPGQRLQLGLGVDVKIVVARRRGVTIVPLKAVRGTGGEKVVLVKRAGGYEERRIATGAEDDDNVEVVRGLEPGEIIAVRPR